MTTKFTGWRKSAAIGLAGLAGFLAGCASPAALNGVPNVPAASPAGITATANTGNANGTSCGCETEHLCSVRAREEITSSDGSGTSKTTIGIAPCVNGSHGDEYFRLYQYHGLGDKTNSNYTAAAVTLPSFKLGKVDNTFTLYGTAGDKQGIGFESWSTLDDLTLVLNAEKNSTTDATRFGFELSKKINDKLTLGGAVDSVNTAGKNTNYLLAHGVYQASDTDQLGAAVRLSDVNSVIGYWGHYGDKESWGTRTWLRGDFGQDTSGFSLDCILAQNPTFGKGSYPWIVSRNSMDSGMFTDVEQVENALSPERVPLGERTKGGWFGEFQANISEQGGSNKGYARVDAGYRFSNVDLGLWNTDIAMLGFYKHGLGDDKTSDFGAGALVKLGKNFVLETTVSGEQTYVGIQYSVPIGNPLKH